jgi:hypothetical protein
MADDMYSDGAYEATETASSPESDTEESETQTALLPQSLCTGMEPGDVIKVRVVEVTETDYMVETVDDDDGEDEEIEETTTETTTSTMDDYLG